MSESTGHRGWGAPASDAEAAAEQRRERRREWVRLQSLAVVVVVVLVDAVVLVAASGVQTVLRNRSGRPCATFWTDLAHDTLIGLWVVVGLLVVTCLLVAWRRWILVATVVVQLVVAAVLVPSLLHTRSQYLAVAAGRLPISQVDSGGVACDAGP